MPSSPEESGRSSHRILEPLPNGPPPVGPYSTGVEIGGWLFLSGQIALESSGMIVQGGVGAEAELIFERVRQLLASAGLSPRNVVKLTLYLVDMASFQTVNQACARFFEEPFPARTTVEVSALPKGAKLEVDVIAFRFDPA